MILSVPAATIDGIKITGLTGNFESIKRFRVKGKADGKDFDIAMTGVEKWDSFKKVLILNGQNMISSVRFKLSISLNENKVALNYGNEKKTFQKSDIMKIAETINHLV